MVQGNNQKTLPNIFVIAAPSATGKTTLVEMLIEKMGDKLIRCVTATSRASRVGEVHGDHYYFYPDGEFDEKLKQGFFLEWASVHGKMYGLSTYEMNRLLTSGKAPLMILDIQGLKHLRENLDKKVYNKIVDIFIVPPSEEEVVRRMKTRGDVGPSEVKVRLETMRVEMTHADNFSHIIVNDDLSGV